MAIMMVKMMIIIMLMMMMMILIAIKIMDIEYICRISLNTMQIKVSSAMIYDFNQLVCIWVSFCRAGKWPFNVIFFFKSRASV